MVLVPAKTTKRKTTVAQSSPAKKTKVTPAKKAPAGKAKAGTRRGSPNKNNAEDEEEEVEETTEEVEEEGSGNEEEGKEGEEEEGDENEEGDEEGGEEGDEAENAGETTAEGEGETKPEVAPSPIKKGSGPSKLEAFVFQNLNPHTSIADVHRVLRVNGLDGDLVNASIIVEFKPNSAPKNFLENAAKITFGGDHEKFKVGKYKPLEITEYVDNIPPPSVNFKPWLKISVLDLAEDTTKEEVKEIVEGVVGEEVKVDTGNTTSMVVTFQSEKAFGKLLVHDDLKVKDKSVRLKIPFVSGISRNSDNRRSNFSPRKNGVSGSPGRGGRGGNAGGGGFGGGRGGGGGGFYGGPKRGRGTGRMGGGYGYPYMRPY